MMDDAAKDFHERFDREVEALKKSIKDSMQPTNGFVACVALMELINQCWSESDPTSTKEEKDFRVMIEELVDITIWRMAVSAAWELVRDK